MLKLPASASLLALVCVLSACDGAGESVASTAPPVAAPPSVSQDDADVDAIALRLISDIVKASFDDVGANGDPYGVSVGVKVSVRTDTIGTDGGEVHRTLDGDAVVKALDGLILTGQRFSDFSMEQPRKYSVTQPGEVFYVAGITPGDAGDLSGIQVTGITRYSDLSSGGVFRRVVVSASVVVAHKTPDNGEISGVIQYIDEQGSPQEWDPALFGKSYPELRYRRLGPGESKVNSGDDLYKERWLKTGLNGKGSFSYASGRPMAPGHYYPSVRLNGCQEQVWEDIKTDKAGYEQVVGLAGTPSWAEWGNPGGLILAEKIKDVKIKTRFSTGNKVTGTVKDGAGKTLAEERDVLLYRFDTSATANPLVEPERVKTQGGKYSFDKVESGLWMVGLEGESPVMASVCNTEEEGPNATYEVNLKSSSGFLWNIETEDEVKVTNSDYHLWVTAKWTSIPLIVGEAGGSVPGGMDDNLVDALKRNIQTAHPQWQFRDLDIMPILKSQGQIPATSANVLKNSHPDDFVDLAKRTLYIGRATDRAGYRIEEPAEGDGSAFLNTCHTAEDAECSNLLSSILARKSFTIQKTWTVKVDENSTATYRWAYRFTPVAGAAF